MTKQFPGEQGESRPTPFDKPLSPPSMRASDADRDRVAEILREALAEGRLDAEEHAERIDAVYRARTRAELDPLVSDLPTGQPLEGSPTVSRPVPAAPPVEGGAGHNVVAVFGGAERRGRWRVGARVNAVAFMGGVKLDLTQAIFEQQVVTLRVTAAFGGVEIRVPENVSVRGAGSGIFGGFLARDHEAADPGAPMVIIRGVALFGGVDVKRVPGERVRDLRGPHHK